jgi:hypothetical protein
VKNYTIKTENIFLEIKFKGERVEIAINASRACQTRGTRSSTLPSLHRERTKNTIWFRIS